jgi:hypothetical protein
MQRREELTKSGADSGGANDEELGKLVGQLTLEEKVRLQDLLLDRQAVPRLWFGLTRRLLQLDLPVGRVLRRARRSGGLGCPVGDVALDCDAVGAFDGSEPAATRVSRVAMAWRLRRP